MFSEVAILKQAIKSFDLSHVMLSVAVLIALTFLVMLAHDNVRQRALQARLRSNLETASGTLSGPPEAQVGDIVPPFEGTTLTGKPRRVADANANHILFIMSLDCDACLSQIPIWNSIVEKIDNQKYSALGIVVGNRTVTVPPTNFEVLPLPSLSIQRAYRVVAVPAVMVVSNGRIKWVHYGQLNGNLTLDLISAIKNGANRH